MHSCLHFFHVLRLVFLVKYRKIEIYVSKSRSVAIINLIISLFLAMALMIYFENILSLF